MVIAYSWICDTDVAVMLVPPVGMCDLHWRNKDQRKWEIEGKRIYIAFVLGFYHAYAFSNLGLEMYACKWFSCYHFKKAGEIKHQGIPVPLL